jgi:hypothetical protein
VTVDDNNAPKKRNKNSGPEYTTSPNPPLIYTKYTIKKAEPIIVPAETPKNRIDIVRPASFVKQNSLSAKTVGFANAVKEIANEAINNIKTEEVALNSTSDSAQIKLSVIKGRIFDRKNIRS